VATKLQQSGFEYGKQATRTCSYYYDVCFNHANFLNAAKIIRPTQLCYNNQLEKWLNADRSASENNRISFMFDH
jgi:hypothetical protein